MLRFDISQEYKGNGVSQGLNRGLLVYANDRLIVEEGMGLGACAVRTGGYTYFTSVRSIQKTGALIEVVCSIDLTQEVTVWGIKSKLIPKAQEYIVSAIYMKHKKTQKPILALWAFSRMIFRVQSRFVKVPQLGEVRIVYSPGSSEVRIDVSCSMEKPMSRFFVMNELGGSIFSKSIVDGRLSDPPCGWQKMDGPCELYSKDHSLAFTMEEKHIPEDVQSSLYWGREKVAGNCCWAGFESEIV
ncbi:MAG: hypothetical protein WCP73_08485, partial [Eubacteriales bacterium]